MAIHQAPSLDTELIFTKETNDTMETKETKEAKQCANDGYRMYDSLALTTCNETN
jgi:hypothetical protein